MSNAAGHGQRRATALVLTIATVLAAPALATPRVLVYAADDTPQLRAALVGVREAIGATSMRRRLDARRAVRRRLACRALRRETVVITLGTHASELVARAAPSLAAGRAAWSRRRTRRAAHQMRSSCRSKSRSTQQIVWLRTFCCRQARYDRPPVRSGA